MGHPFLGRDQLRRASSSHSTQVLENNPTDSRNSHPDNPPGSPTFFSARKETSPSSPSAAVPVPDHSHPLGVSQSGRGSSYLLSANEKGKRKKKAKKLRKRYGISRAPITLLCCAYLAGGFILRRVLSCFSFYISRLQNPAHT